MKCRDDMRSDDIATKNIAKPLGHSELPRPFSKPELEPPCSSKGSRMILGNYFKAADKSVRVGTCPYCHWSNIC